METKKEKTEVKHYAVYQEGDNIWGVGKSRNAAIRNAKNYVEDGLKLVVFDHWEQAEELDDDGNKICGLNICQITKELYDMHRKNCDVLFYKLNGLLVKF